MPNPEDSQFTSITGRIAGLKSGVERRPLDKEEVAKRSHKYAEAMMDLIFERIMAPQPCDKCKRGGPADSRLLASLAKSLVDLIQLIQSRAWGTPAKESRYGRQASLDDYKVLRSFVNSPDVEPPGDLPPPPEQTNRG